MEPKKARLFVAALPDESTSRKLSEACSRWHRLNVPELRWTSPNQWHVTLAFLGLADPIEATRSLAALRTASCVGRLGPTTTALGKNSLVIPVSGLDRLAADVQVATTEIHREGNRVFFGHLTLARSRQQIPARWLGQPLIGDFPVEKVCLVRSHTLPEGARYEVLEWWPL